MCLGADFSQSHLGGVFSDQFCEQKRKFIWKIRYGAIPGFVFHREVPPAAGTQ
jgi:hypothetical protein